MTDHNHSGFQQAENSLGRELWRALNLADEAHHGALVDAQVLTPAQLRNSKSVLRALFLVDIETCATFSGDVFDQRLAWLESQGFRELGWLNLGRARREAITVAFHWEIRLRFLQNLYGVAHFALNQIDTALENLESLIPDFTYLAPTQPTSWAHLIHSHICCLHRTLNRGCELLARLEVSPAGHGSTNGSRLPLGRKFLADRLSFSSVSPNTRDSVLRADLLLEIEQWVAGTGLFLHRWTSEYLHFLSPQVGYFRLRDASLRRSLILPQKQNPYRLSLLRGLCTRLMGRPNELMILLAGLPHQPEQRMMAFEQNFSSLQNLDRAFSEAQRAFEDLQHNPEVSRRESFEHLTLSTELAETLAEKGIDYRVASGWVAEAFQNFSSWENSVRKLEGSASAAGLSISLGTEPESFLRQSLGSRAQAGSSSPVSLRVELEDLKRNLNQLATGFQARISSLEKTASERKSEVLGESK